VPHRGVHPIAGQGLDLGWRDVAARAEVPVDARRLGLDIGQIDALERCEVWCRFDTIETEEEPKAAGIAYKLGNLPFSAKARAPTTTSKASSKSARTRPPTACSAPT
jgi:hypothetical protein